MYRSIVFLDHEETDHDNGITQDEALRILHHKPSDPDHEDYGAVLWEMPTEESVNAALDYLLQWDYGQEDSEPYDESPAGSGDWRELVTRNGRVYEIAYNVGLSYIGLCEIKEQDDGNMRLHPRRRRGKQRGFFQYPGLPRSLGSRQGMSPACHL